MKVKLKFSYYLLAILGDLIPILIYLLTFVAGFLIGSEFWGRLGRWFGPKV